MTEAADLAEVNPDGADHPRLTAFTNQRWNDNLLPIPEDFLFDHDRRVEAHAVDGSRWNIAQENEVIFGVPKDFE